MLDFNGSQSKHRTPGLLALEKGSSTPQRLRDPPRPGMAQFIQRGLPLLKGLFGG